MIVPLSVIFMSIPVASALNEKKKCTSLKSAPSGWERAHKLKKNFERPYDFI